MHIDWQALVTVALVSIVSSVLFVGLLAAGIRLVVTGRPQPAPVPTSDRRRTPGSRDSSGGSALLQSAGWALLALAALLVLYGLYLIVPQLH